MNRWLRDTFSWGIYSKKEIEIKWYTVRCLVTLNFYEGKVNGGLPKRFRFVRHDFDRDIRIYYLFPLSHLYLVLFSIYVFFMWEWALKLRDKEISNVKNRWYPVWWRDGWIGGYHAAMQQYGLNPIPSIEIFDRYHLLQQRGILEQVSKGKTELDTIPELAYLTGRVSSINIPVKGKDD